MKHFVVPENIHTHPGPRMVIGNSEGVGGLSQERDSREIPKQWGNSNQKPSMSRVWVFSGTTQ